MPDKNVRSTSDSETFTATFAGKPAVIVTLFASAFASILGISNYANAPPTEGEIQAKFDKKATEIRHLQQNLAQLQSRFESTKHPPDYVDEGLRDCAQRLRKIEDRLLIMRIPGSELNGR